MAVSLRTEKLPALQDRSYPLLKIRTQGLLSIGLSPIQRSPSLMMPLCLDVEMETG